jgi:hypothetical protein
LSWPKPAPPGSRHRNTGRRARTSPLSGGDDLREHGIFRKDRGDSGEKRGGRPGNLSGPRGNFRTGRDPAGRWPWDNPRKDYGGVR